MRLSVSRWWDWPAVFMWSGWNWVDFRVIHLSWEWTRYADSFSVDMGLLGFSAEITISWLAPSPTDESAPEQGEGSGS